MTNWYRNTMKLLESNSFSKYDIEASTDGGETDTDHINFDNEESAVGFGKSYASALGHKNVKISRDGNTLYDGLINEGPKADGYELADGTVIPYKQWFKVSDLIEIMPLKTTFRMRFVPTGEVSIPSGQYSRDTLMMALYKQEEPSTYAYYCYGEEYLDAKKMLEKGTTEVSESDDMKTTLEPTWRVAEYAGVDSEGNRYQKGDLYFYYPLTMTVLTGERAERAAKEYEAEAKRNEVSEGYGRRSFSGDPRWIVAKYNGVDNDGNPFKKGEKIFYYPNTKTILTGEKAEQAARDFSAAADDEGLFEGDDFIRNDDPDWKAGYDYAMSGKGLSGDTYIKYQNNKSYYDGYQYGIGEFDAKRKKDADASSHEFWDKWRQTND